MRDYYEVLGIRKDADAGDIKRAYRSMAKKYHPDVNPGDTEAADRFKEAANAYKVLSDSDLRARYDRFGPEGVTGGAGFQGFSGAEDVFSAFGDLFGDFFGGRRQRGPGRGRDVQVAVGLSFAEAVHGVTRELDVTLAETCEPCSGSGAKPGSSPEICGTCEGRGQVMHSQGFFMIQTTCPACGGQGQTIRNPCDACGGKGRAKKSRKLTVDIPPGVEEGQQLRLAGKGEPGPPGGQPGHLYVVLQVADDERFLRDGPNILSEIPISYLTALLGGEVSIPVLEDDCEGTTTLDVPAGTQPGDTIVRRGEGIAHVSGRGRGDHVLALKVVIPKKLSSRERELVESLAAESGVEVSEKKGIFDRFKL